MNGYGSLAYTGAGSLTLAGLVVDQMWLAGSALGIVAIGALLVRATFRRGKTPADV